ncbi:hypothetical protein AB0958_21915 [Streptomyces sp. NPDC006655]|uniref:hypothetical protein n=1 Tax=Streptomyces sp. NPDC006655 TaxID=3156898 RepID=UPI0034556086
MAEFKVDQEVKYKGMEMPARIISGPHPTYGADRWLVRKADGKVTLAREADLTPILDTREKVAKAIYEGVSAYGYRWEIAGHATRAKYLAIADKVAKAVAPAPTRPLAVGDRIRILKSGLDWASVRRGDVLTVQRLEDDKTFRTNAPGYGRDTWVFKVDSEGTGWERVA